MYSNDQRDVDLEKLLADVKQRGIELRVEGDRLRFTAPQGALTPDIRALLQSYKPELIEFLSRPRARRYPASFVQRRFWTLQQLDPADAFYNVPFAFHLRGPLDAGLLRTSFNAIVGRHDSLRTTLHQVDGALVQVVAPEGQVQMVEKDLEGAPVELVLLEDMQRPFDLARETGLRVLLLHVSPEEHFLQLCLHNTLFDQSSVLVLLKELSEHSSAIAGGGRPAELAAPAQYHQYVDWQESLLAAGMEERRNYWREWFSKGEPPQWSWPRYKQAPEKPGFHACVTRMGLSPELSREIRALSHRNGVTSYITLMTAYALLLRRYSGCADLTIGTTYSNRHDWKFASLVGATIDVPALRFDMSDDPPVEELLKRVREVVGSALIHQDVPFDRVVPGRANRPLFRAVFSYFPETAHGRLRLPGVEVTFLEEVINELSRPDLYLVVSEGQEEAGEVFTVYWMHKRDVFTEEVAREMSGEFEGLLRGMVGGRSEEGKVLNSRDSV